MTKYTGNDVPDGCEIVPVPYSGTPPESSVLGFIVFHAIVETARRAAKTYTMLGMLLTDDQMISFIDHEIRHTLNSAGLAQDLFQDHVEGIKFSINLEVLKHPDKGLMECFVVEGLIVNSEKYWAKLQLEPSFKEASDILGVTFDRIAAESTVEHMLAMRTESDEE